MVVHNLFPAGVGRLLLRTTEGIALYDAQVFKIIARLTIASRHPIKVYHIYTEQLEITIIKNKMFICVEYLLFLLLIINIQN